MEVQYTPRLPFAMHEKMKELSRSKTGKSAKDLFAVYCYLLTYNGNQSENTVYPSLRTIAEDLEMHHSSVHKCLDILSKIGWITAKLQKGRSGNRYEISPINVSSPRHIDQNNVSSPRHINQKNVSSSRHINQKNVSSRSKECVFPETSNIYHEDKPVKDIPITPPTPPRASAKVTVKKSGKSEILSEMEFSRFWETYPQLKRNKQDAIQKWNARIRDGVDPADMITGAANYAQERRFEDPRYTMGAARFIGPSAHYIDHLAPIVVDPMAGEPARTRRNFANMQKAIELTNDSEDQK